MVCILSLNRRSKKICTDFVFSTDERFYRLSCLWKLKGGHKPNRSGLKLNLCSYSSLQYKLFSLGCSTQRVASVIYSPRVSRVVIFFIYILPCSGCPTKNSLMLLFLTLSGFCLMWMCVHYLQLLFLATENSEKFSTYSLIALYKPVKHLQHAVRARFDACNSTPGNKWRTHAACIGANIWDKSFFLLPPL